MIKLFTLIILTFGSILLLITGMGVPYGFYIDMLAALGILLLTLFVTLMSTSIRTLIKTIKFSITSTPLAGQEFRTAAKVFEALERNLIISIMLVITLNSVGYLAVNATLPNVNWFRVVSLGLLDPMYGLIYLLLLQGLKNRLKELE